MPTHNKIAPERLALCLEALDTGAGYAAVSRQYGVAKTTLQKHFPGKPFRPHTEADYANWESALDEGYAYKHVGEMYGVDQHTVARKFPDRGWTLEQAQQHGALMSRSRAMV